MTRSQVPGSRMSGLLGAGAGAALGVGGPGKGGPGANFGRRSGPISALPGSAGTFNDVPPAPGSAGTLSEPPVTGGEPGGTPTGGGAGGSGSGAAAPCGPGSPGGPCSPRMTSTPAAMRSATIASTTSLKMGSPAPGNVIEPVPWRPWIPWIPGIPGSPCSPRSPLGPGGPGKSSKAATWAISRAKLSTQLTVPIVARHVGSHAPSASPHISWPGGHDPKQSSALEKSFGQATVPRGCSGIGNTGSPGGATGRNICWTHSGFSNRAIHRMRLLNASKKRCVSVRAPGGGW